MNHYFCKYIDCILRIFLIAALMCCAKAGLGKTAPDEKNVIRALSTKPDSKELKQTQKKLADIAQDTTQAIFSILGEKRETYKKETESFYHDVENILNPVVAFSAITRSVMGKYAHRVSPAEMEEFTKIFRRSLLVFYSAVLQNYDTGDLRINSVKPPPLEYIADYAGGEKISVPVDMIVNSGKQSYQLSYSMMQIAGGDWKIRNIIVEGINIGSQFRNQFASAVDTYRSPGEAIKNWNSFMKNKPINGPSVHSKG